MEGLRINMDETSICLWQGDGKGAVLCSKTRRRRWSAEVAEDEGADVGQPANRKARRTCFTHVAFICDRPEVQPLLPQVLIGNCSTFLVSDWQQLLAQCPPNVYLIRQKSAWNNAEVCARILRILGVVLRPLSARFQPILLMGARNVHLRVSVAECCSRQGIWLVVIPARLTGLMQPCDTHAFQSYKVNLKKFYQRLRAAHPTGKVSVADFLAAVYSTIRTVLQGQKWALAFDRDGFGAGVQGAQSQASGYLLRQLALSVAPAVGASQPGEDVLALCYPRNRAVPATALLRPLAGVAPLAVAGPAQPVAQPTLTGPALPVARGQLVIPKRPAPPPAGPLTRQRARDARLRLALSASSAASSAQTASASSGQPPLQPGQVARALKAKGR